MMNGRILPYSLIANFVASDISGSSPMSVTFINTSYGDYDQCLWDFGDGATSGQENPIHTYTAPGVYTVTLTVSRPGGRDTIAKASYITVRPEEPAYFSHNESTFVQPAAGFAW